MTTKMPHKDVVIVGFGWTGAIMAEQLTNEGLDVLALERGLWRDTSTDYAVTNAQDEVRYRYRDELFEALSRETLTFRNRSDQTALPMRMLGSFLPGTGVGGSGVHWNGQTWRFLPSDFQARSHNIERYGADAIPEDMTIQDWGITYDELEPHYDTFEKICGISGKAGNLNGEIREGGNPFEGPRSSEYPNPADEHGQGADGFCRRGAGAGLFPVSRSLGEYEPGLYQSARGPARTLHLLRLLRKIRLRQLFQGDRQHDDPAGADAAEELHPANRLDGAACRA